MLNVVCGYGHEVGAALSRSNLISKLDITGGTETGRVVAANAGKNLASCIAELGGKAPVVIFKDCDLEDAVNGATFAAFIASGQTCVMGSRVLVDESIHDEFLRRFIAKVQRIKLGDPLDPTTQMGPVISRQQLLKIHEFVETAKSEGGIVSTGGNIKSGKGYFYEPTIISNVSRHMKIFQQEVFGPVVSVTPFKSEEEAVHLANDSEFGLACSLWTKDVKRAHRVASKIDVGIVWVNGHHHNDPSSPWGGMKASGIGRENGREAFDAYTQPKSVVINYGKSSDWFGDISARYG